MCVCVCQGKGKADELHFLLAADRGSPARSPINRLKDKDVRKNERPLAFRQAMREEGRGKRGGGGGGGWRWDCENVRKMQR